MANIFYMPFRPAYDSAGVAVPGAQAYFTLTGTNTPSAPFEDAGLTSAAENPVVANGVGKFPTVYMDPDITYRVRVYSPDAEVGVDTPLEEFEPYDSGIALSVAANGLVFTTPQMYGALANGVTDDSASFVAAIAALKAYALNLSANGYYVGSPKLFVPAGHYYLGSTTLDITHNLIIEGDGGGRFTTQSGGVTRLRWANGVCGIRVQAADTSGTTTKDSPLHAGSAGTTLRSLKLEGAYGGTESASHAIVARSFVTLDDVYIYGWSGNGVEAIAASTGTYSSYGGNVSSSHLKSVRIENCTIGLDIKGADANVISAINCELIGNRQAGYWDDSGIGANILIGIHAANNGFDGKSQCTYSSKHYAAKLGGTFTNTPTGTTADSADWLYIEAGTADTAHPAHTATPSTFRAGGDYIVANDTAVVTLSSAYSEEGSFSQFGASTLVSNPTISDRYMRGGVVLRATSDGFKVQGNAKITGNTTSLGNTTALGPQSGTAADKTLFLDNTNAESAIYPRTNGSAYSYTRYINGTGVFRTANGGSGHEFRHGTYGAEVRIASILGAGIDLATGKILSVNGTQVVGARQTGTPADATDLATALTLVNALKAKLITHGLIS